MVEYAKRADVHQALYIVPYAGLDHIARTPDSALFELGNPAFHGCADVVDKLDAVHREIHDFRLPQASVHDRHFAARTGRIGRGPRSGRTAQQQAYRLSYGTPTLHQGGT